MSIEIVYETHSTTEDNERCVTTGWLPGTLSSTGRDQARRLGDRRRDDAAVRVPSDITSFIDGQPVAVHLEL